MPVGPVIWLRIAPYLAGAALVAAVWGHGYMTGHDGAKAAHAAAVARAQAETIRAAEAASRYAAEAREAIAADASRIETELDGGGDAPLSDYLRDASGRLWP